MNGLTVLELRNILTDLLAPELGQFAGGMPSIWVEPPAAPVGNITGGIECIISRHKQLLRSESLSSNQIYQNYDLVVTLVQFDLSESGSKKLDSAISKMRSSFPNHRERSLLYMDDAYPQVTFLINEHAVLNQQGF